MTWTVLRSVECWKKYQQEVARVFNCPADAIAWGSGPATYPCLVDTIRSWPLGSTMPRFMTAYVYEADFAMLREAKTEKPTQAVQDKTGDDSPLPRTHDDFRRYLVAYLLTTLETLCEIRATTEERLERDLARMLRIVDEYMTEKKQALEDLNAGTRKALDRLHHSE